MQNHSIAHSICHFVHAAQTLLWSMSNAWFTSRSVVLLLEDFPFLNGSQTAPDSLDDFRCFLPNTVPPNSAFVELLLQWSSEDTGEKQQSSSCPHPCPSRERSHGKVFGFTLFLVPVPINWQHQYISMTKIHIWHGILREKNIWRDFFSMIYCSWGPSYMAEGPQTGVAIMGFAECVWYSFHSGVFGHILRDTVEKDTVIMYIIVMGLQILITLKSIFYYSHFWVS